LAPATVSFRCLVRIRQVKPDNQVGLLQQFAGAVHEDALGHPPRPAGELSEIGAGVELGQVKVQHGG
jgi:hypothetical protein